jgi:hypothetical protein
VRLAFWLTWPVENCLAVRRKPSTGNWLCRTPGSLARQKNAVAGEHLSLDRKTNDFSHFRLLYSCSNWANLDLSAMSIDPYPETPRVREPPTFRDATHGHATNLGVHLKPPDGYRARCAIRGIWVVQLSGQLVTPCREPGTRIAHMGTGILDSLGI